MDQYFFDSFGFKLIYSYRFVYSIMNIRKYTVFKSIFFMSTENELITRNVF